MCVILRVQILITQAVSFASSSAACSCFRALTWSVRFYFSVLVASLPSSLFRKISCEISLRRLAKGLCLSLSICLCSCYRWWMALLDRCKVVSLEAVSMGAMFSSWAPTPGSLFWFWGPRRNGCLKWSKEVREHVLWADNVLIGAHDKVNHCRLLVLSGDIDSVLEIDMIKDREGDWLCCLAALRKAAKDLVNVGGLAWDIFPEPLVWCIACSCSNIGQVVVF